MKIRKEEVEYVAHLARLEFGEEETEKFTLQLNDILTYIDKLNQAETTGVSPMTHAMPLVNAFREDTVISSCPTNHPWRMHRKPGEAASAYPR